MKKFNTKGKIAIILIFFVVAVIGGVIIQSYDNRYREFFVEKRPLGELISEAPTQEPVFEDSSEEEKVYVNINTDQAYELARLEGIGESMAKRIINYRREHGNFEVIEDLMRVSGIGEKKFELIKSSIYVE